MYKLLSIQIAGICISFIFAGAQNADPVSGSHQPRAFEQIPANAAGDEAIAGGVNPWHYWGADFDYDTYRIEPEAWRESDDVVDGWDWSLPPSVEPAENAKIRLGFHGWRRGIAEYNPPPGLTVVDELWVYWREIEEVEGEYDFTQVKAEIAKRLDAGCDGVIIRMLGAVWTAGSPEDWEQWENGQKWRFRRWSAPRWLVDTYGIDKLPVGEGSSEVIHVDIFHQEYHRQYSELIKAFKDSGILDMPEVFGLTVGGMCRANGEEGHGTYELSKIPRDIAEQRYRDRLVAWQNAFDDPHKVIAMLKDGKTMVGARDGFVEMYLYLTDEPDKRGQYVDEAGYLSVNEDAFYIRHGKQLLFGDENEEYNPERWADRPGRPGRFGPVESFNYRYFTSMLRMLQMRRNYLYADEITPDPELLWYVLHGLGRTADDAPDAWCFLRESHLSGGGGDSAKGKVKNFDRWLYQRDQPSYETTPAVKIPHAIKNWWLADDDHRYDYVARKGERIGFTVDEKFLSGSANVAVKVSYYNGFEGSWALRYHQAGKVFESDRVQTTGTDAFRTATFFIEADFGAADFDFEIVSPDEVPISFVRMIKN